MGVQLASELDPVAEAERLAKWAASDRASGGPGGWLAPGREAGEQWQAMIRGGAGLGPQSRGPAAAGGDAQPLVMLLGGTVGDVRGPG